MAVVTESFYIPSKVDGLQLSVMTITPDCAPVGIVQISHGMCEHKERYIPIMEFLASKGFACIIHDHRGHGGSVKSEEDLGYFYQGGEKGLIADVALVGTQMKKKHPGLPFYLLGHSMGSLIARAYLKKLDFTLDGLIISGCPVYVPGCKMGQSIVKFLEAFKGDHGHSKMLDRLSKYKDDGRFAGEDSPNAWVCSNPDILTEYDNDPLTQFHFTLSGYQALFKTMEMVYSPKGWKVTKPNLPIWFISGEDDPCMGSEERFLEAIDILRQVGYDNISYQIYPHMRHEVLNETEKEIVWTDLEEKLMMWNQKITDALSKQLDEE